MKQVTYVHHIYQLGWFRVSVYILNKRFSIRFEISSGWDN